MAVVMAATAGSPAKAVRLSASQGRDEVATDVPTPDCKSCPLERRRSEIKLKVESQMSQGKIDTTTAVKGTSEVMRGLRTT